MIPKIIHFCWFGGNPLPPLAQECIASWRKHLPEYKIIQWVEASYSASHTVEVANGGSEVDEIRTFDVDIIPYTAEAYKQKKYAFVSDYARFWIMYRYGGIYFDTDVEVIRPMYNIIEDCCSNSECSSSLTSNHDSLTSHHGFMGFEVDPDGENTPGKYAPRYCFAVNPGIGFGMEKEHPFMKTIIDYYSSLQFEVPPTDIAWYKTIVAYTTELLCNEGLKNVEGIQHVGDITIYPHEYFAPINVITGRLKITKNTRTIHRYMGSWSANKGVTVKSLTVNGLVQLIRHYLPEWVLIMMNKIKRRGYRATVNV